MSASILQFKDRKKAVAIKEQYVMKGYEVVTETDDTIMLERTLLTGAAKWVVAVLFFPIGLLVFLKQKVSLMIDESSLLYTTPTESKEKNHDLYAELTKLDDLRNRGILTEEEFKAKKTKLLSA